MSQNVNTGNKLEAFSAAVFDLDGVVTRTAKVHAAVWKTLFDDYLRQRAETFEPFDLEADYRRYVDGKPRYEGVQSFLESRGLTLPYGHPDDPPDHETICGLGNRKNELFHQQLAQDGVEVYDDTVTFIRALRARGIKTALVSSSKNAKGVLDAAGLAGLFDACVDGVESARIGFKGKPAPDIFLHAASLLNVAPDEAFAVEDAISGVQAARAAGFGLVIGIDRNGHGAALREYGADMVVSDLEVLAPIGTTSPARLPDAMESFDEIEQRLANNRPAVFLDYDGTLTPIVSRPDLAVLSEDVRATIRELAGQCAVAIVSGRDRADVQRLVDLDELVYAGSHGFDITGPGGLEKQHEKASDFLAALDRAEEQVHSAVAGIEGALVERKRYAIAVHYRLVAGDDIAGIEAAVDAAVKDASPNLRKTGGKKIFEIRPQLPWDKGRAVMWLLHALDLDQPDVLPMYLGDDETDEDAFAAIRERGGLGILVAAEPQRTSAHYLIPDPEGVGRFLRRLVDLLRERGS